MSIDPVATLRTHDLQVTAQRLEKKGIRTCADVRAYDIFRFVQQFGQFGEHIHRLAHGIDDRPVVSEWRRKSVSVEHTYDEDLPDLQSCLQKLPALLESLQPRLSFQQGGERGRGATHRSGRRARHVDRISPRGSGSA